MTGRSFLDTSVLLYTDDADSPEKQRRALDLIGECRGRRTGVVSTHVLQEYFVTATRKLRLATEVARRKTEIFGRLHLVTPGLDDVVGAIDLHRLHDLAFWDALIVRSALVSGCSRLFSEDLQRGRRFEGAQVVNPFH